MFEFLEVRYSNICYLSGVRTFESSETHKYLSLWMFCSFLCEISVGIILGSLWRILEHRYSKNQPRKYPGMNFKYLCQNTKIKKKHVANFRCRPGTVHIVQITFLSDFFLIFETDLIFLNIFTNWVVFWKWKLRKCVESKHLYAEYKYWTTNYGFPSSTKSIRLTLKVDLTPWQASKDI